MLDIFVSPKGSDSADGSQSNPLFTLTAARDRVRAAKTPGRILLRVGFYENASLELGPQDCGLRIEAFEHEMPVLSGGVAINRWICDPQDDRFLFAPLTETLDPSTWDFRSLIINNEFAPRARLPGQGRLTHESRFDSHWMSSTAGGWDRKPTALELTTLKYREGDLGDWLVPQNAEITVFHQWDDSMVGVKSIDTATRTMTFQSACGHPPGAFLTHGHNPKAAEYIVWNVLEGMHQPGQWFLDRKRGGIVYWPRIEEDSPSLKVIAPRQRQLIRIAATKEGVPSDITIKGITLAHTATRLESAGFGAMNLDGAITLNGACSVYLDSLTLRHIGGIGIKGRPFDNLTPLQDIHVTNCRIEEAGGPGISISAQKSFVENCFVHRVGLQYPASLALSLGGLDNVIQKNHVCGCPYTAIQSSGTRIRIEHNIIEDFMRELDDGAAIYVFGAKQCELRGNFARGSSGRLAHAYYLDEQSEGSIVEANVALDTQWPSHNHMATSCIIRNNVFLDHSSARITMNNCTGFKLSGNIIACTGDLAIYFTKNNGCTIEGNLFSGMDSIKANYLDAGGYNTAEVAELPLGKNQIGTPLFIDIDKGDFRLKPGTFGTEIGIIGVKLDPWIAEILIVSEGLKY